MPDAISGLEGDLRSNGISVESIDPGGETVELVYTAAFPDVSVDHREVDRALGTFVDVAERSSASSRTSSGDAAERDEREPTRVETLSEEGQ